jgi:hypothetical protein
MTHAGTMSAASDRKAIEDNADSWSAQAVILQRLEDGIQELTNQSLEPAESGTPALTGA